MKFERSLLAGAVLGTAGLAAAFPTAAQTSGESPWLVRVRAVRIQPANDFNPTEDWTEDVPSDSVHVSNKTIPEFDISYFFTPHIASELVLTYPQKHDAYITEGPNKGAKGTLKELPPTLTLQYHFTNNISPFSPYVGAGVNYTHFSSVHLGELNIEKHSFGPVLQAGMSYVIDKNWSLNFDVKKVWMDTKVSDEGDKIGKVKIDPWLFGLGVGYRF